MVRIRNSPGAAGGVAANPPPSAPGQALGVVGDDGLGRSHRALEARGIDTAGLVRSAGRYTPTYTKPMLHEPDGRAHEASRLDVKNRAPLPGAIEDDLLARLADLLPACDGVLIADQAPERNCGVVTDRVREALGDLADEHPETVFLVDSRTRIGEYRGVMLKPNDREAIGALTSGETAPPTRDRAEEAGRALARRAGRPVFVTIGAGGVLVCDGEGCTRVPAVPVTGAIDIVGAGDSTIAGLAAALAAGATCEEAALVGNLVASVTIRQIGVTGTATPAQVRAALGDWRGEG